MAWSRRAPDLLYSTRGRTTEAPRSQYSILARFGENPFAPPPTPQTPETANELFSPRSASPLLFPPLSGDPALLHHTPTEQRHPSPLRSGDPCRISGVPSSQREEFCSTASAAHDEAGLAHTAVHGLPAASPLELTYPNISLFGRPVRLPIHTKAPNWS